MFGGVETARAWAEVDLDALTDNLREVRSRIGARTRVLLVAKADAYGHGAIEVVRQARAAGVEAVGITCCSEALELAEVARGLRTVVLGPSWAAEAREAIQAGIELCAPSGALLGEIEEAARSVKVPARVHLKIDTGMGRLGVRPVEAGALLERIRASRWVELAGVMTHYAGTLGGEEASTRLQAARFDRALEDARERALLEGEEVWIHSANSAAVLTGLGTGQDAVRVGIAAYGLSPAPGLDAGSLRPILSVRTRLVHLNTVERGECVGYGGTWSAPRRSRIAILPVGYDDGVAWRLGNRGCVLLRGRRVPMVGRVSMDYTAIDVTDVPEARLGDRATLLGKDGGESLEVRELAELAGTVPYELLCSIGKRVRRIYVGGRLRNSSSLVV